MALSKETWIEIEKKYVCGVAKDGAHHMPSLCELAKEYNINKSSISRRIVKFGWEIKKQSFINKNGIKIEQKKKEKLQRNEKATHNDTSKSNNEKSNKQPFIGITQEEIDEESEKFSEEVATFDVECSGIAKSIAGVVRSNIDKMNTLIKENESNPDSKKSNVFPERILLDNSRALEVAQKIYKNAIGEGLPDNDITITVKRVISTREESPDGSE
jgi:hypothetical protein